MSSTYSELYIDDNGPIGDPITAPVPVICLHALAGNTGQWAAQLHHLRSGRRALAVDLRGHGRSVLPENDAYDIDGLADDVHAVVGRLGLARVVLVGHSMGGAVAAAYAGRYPDDVAGLVLVDPPGDSTQMPAEQIAQIIGAMESDAYQGFMDGYWGQILTGSTNATAQQVMADLHGTPKATVVGITKALFAYNPAAALRRYSGPKLSVVTPWNAGPTSLHALDPALAHVEMSDTGHWLHMDKPVEFNGILDEFLTATADA
ncbi:MAG: alpha/beta hydrolase [Caldilineaceae bacterium]|nr:alpha/beta hydrolase [Caldilineaceae bacterium]